ncbi:hypothetical protein CDL15_Pgr007037 [Punica granatum]|uniref:Uncharacterized protein n=1 Tax=Punica granatum TaxID=22663 RepID=A0A218X8K5_PUNGR|nr:hypothetical protein CDL15_Pgr007037 [Punica granatum]
MLHLQSFRWATEWDSVRWTEYTTFMGLQSLEQALGQNKPSGTVDIMGIPKDTKDMDMCLLRTLMHTTEDTQVIITSSSPRSNGSESKSELELDNFQACPGGCICEESKLVVASSDLVVSS